MFDLVRVYRILKALVEEDDNFLICQDAYPTITECILRLTELEADIVKAKSLEVDVKSIAKHEIMIKNMEGLVGVSPTLLEHFGRMQMLSIDIYLKSPFDNDTDDESDWSKYKDASALSNRKSNGAGAGASPSLPPGTGLNIASIKAAAQRLLEFDLFTATNELYTHIDEEIESRYAKAEIPGALTIVGKMPPHMLRHYELSLEEDFISSTSYPKQYFDIITKPFAKQLEFSVFRLLAIPFWHVIHSKDHVKTNKAFEEITAKNGIKGTVLSYKTASNAPLYIAWHNLPGEDEAIPRGHVVTQLLKDASRRNDARYSVHLKELMHSLRDSNATVDIHSAQEVLDAALVIDDIDLIKEKIRAVNEMLFDAKEKQQMQLDSLVEGLEQWTEKSFNILKMARRFKSQISTRSDAEERKGMTKRFNLHVNQRQVDVDVLDSLEPINVKGWRKAFVQLIENVISNAIRYTDIKRGIKVLMVVSRKDKVCECRLEIVDYGAGLPDKVVKLLQEAWGEDRCEQLSVVENTPFTSPGSVLRSPLSGAASAMAEVELAQDSPKSGMASSTETGMPHIAYLGSRFDVRVKTGPGRTSFAITHSFKVIPDLTLAPGKSMPSIVPPSLPSIEKSYPYHILVVDDHSVNRRTFVRALVRLGCTTGLIEQAEDGHQALERLQKKPSIDIVFTDNAMPVMRGDAFCQKARAEIKPCPRLVMVSGDDAEELDASMAAVLDGYLVKPATPAQLKDQLEALNESPKSTASTGQVASAFRTVGGVPLTLSSESTSPPRGLS